MGGKEVFGTGATKFLGTFIRGPVLKEVKDAAFPGKTVQSWGATTLYPHVDTLHSTLCGRGGTRTSHIWTLAIGSQQKTRCLSIYECKKTNMWNNTTTR